MEERRERERERRSMDSVGMGMNMGKGVGAVGGWQLGRVTKHQTNDSCQAATLSYGDTTDSLSSFRMERVSRENCEGLRVQD